MKITIVNGYHDSNKGSCAIAWGLIRRLQKTGVAGSISLVSMFRENSPLFESGFRHLRPNLPEVEYLGSPLTGWSDSVNQAPDGSYSHLGHLRWSYSILRKILLINSRSSLLRLGRIEPALRSCLESDLIMERGGPFFAASRNPINPSLYFYAWPLLFARKMAIPYAFAPESIGPLNNPFARRMVASLFRDSTFISVREDISKRSLMDCGLEEQRIHTMLDSAFWVEPRRSPRVASILEKHGLKRKSFLVIVCRQWTPRKQLKYHQQLMAAIKDLVPGVFQKAALVLNAYGPMGGPDDTRAAQQLREMVHDEEIVCLVEEDLAPDELAAIYGEAALVIGARLHSIILALTGGAPVVAVSYGGPKTKGIMQWLGLGRYVVDMEGTDRDAIVSLAHSAVHDQSGVRQTLSDIRQKDDQLLVRYLTEVGSRRIWKEGSAEA